MFMNDYQSLDLLEIINLIANLQQLEEMNKTKGKSITLKNVIDDNHALTHDLYDLIDKRTSTIIKNQEEILNLLRE